MTTSTANLLTTRDVAERLACTPDHVRHLLRARKLRGINLGTDRHPRWRVEPRILTAYLDNRRTL